MALAAATLAAGGPRAIAADVVLGSSPADKIAVQINEKSAVPSAHSIQFSAKAPAVVFTLGGGATDDPVVNGAAAVVFSATDCQCIVMGPAPGTTPGWKASPTSASKKYAWKDAATKSTALVKSGQLKFKKKADITYGLDATPQGEVEVQVRFGTSPDTLCARFAVPATPASDDTATKYKSKAFATGTTACSTVPVMCGSCVPPLATTTTSSSTSTTTTSSTSTTITCGIFVTTWGSSGTGDGQFSIPYDIVADTAGSVYVADTYNHRIQEFDASGTFVRTFGSAGFADGQFDFPSGLALDGSGNVWVADTNHHRIQKFDAMGTFLAKFGTGGTGDGQLQDPFDVVVDGAGGFYVADTGNTRVQKFDASGAFVTKWGTPGTGNGQFNHPAGIALDGAGNVYVTDANNGRVQKFDATGMFLTKWDAAAIGDALPFGPWGLAVDAGGRVFVADVSMSRTTVFTGVGSFLAQWGSSFSNPRGVAVGAAGTVFVADTGNNRIQKFSCP